MLNISVLVKQVYDARSINWDWEGKRLKFAKPSFNGADLSALQWACNFRKENEAYIRVFSFIESEGNGEVSRLKKHRPDEIVLLKSPASNIENFQKATSLALELSRHPFDLIICGSEGEDTLSGATPFIIAEHLNLPCFSQAYQIEADTNGKWKVSRKAGGGIVQNFRVGLPAVIGVIPSLVERCYVPSNPGQNFLGRMIEKEVSTEGDKKLVLRRATAPKPSIRSGDVSPSSLRAPERFLQTAGLTTQGEKAAAASLLGEASVEHIRFAARKISNWLKEG